MRRTRFIFGATAAALAAGIFLSPQTARADHDDHCPPPPRRGYHYDDYDDYPRYRDYRPRRVHRRWYRCHDCGRRFRSPYWLRYHHRHSDCD